MSWSIEKQSVLYGGWPSQWPTASWEPVSQRVSMAQKAPRYLLNFLAVYWFWANPITTTLDSEKIFWAKLSLSDAFCVKGGTTLVQPIIITRYKMQENHREPTKDLQSKELTTAISPLFCASSSAIPNQLETPCHFRPIAHPKRKSYPPFSSPGIVNA